MSRRIDVALATAAELDEPDFDLEPLSSALAAAGLRCAVRAWDDPQADFSSATMTILRSTWNYPRSPRRFIRWVERTAGRSDLWNRPALVRWNLHKRYLLELERAGVPVCPTRLVPRGSAPGLAEIARSRGWRKLVVKPAVSASSMATLAVGRDDLDRGQEHLTRLVERGDALVQEYQPAVEDHGERALVFIDGKLTHAVRKEPRFAGDDESASARAVEISAAEAALAESAMAAARKGGGEAPLYGRIDVVLGAAGTPVVMEVELIEPSLYLSRSRPALERLVAAIRSRLRAPARDPEAG